MHSAPSIPNTAQSSVCAIVVTYNRLTLLKECIQALQSQSRRLDKILVINNGSTDDTKDWLDGQNELWVIHQENLGGAGGFHRGVKEAHLAKYDLLWLLDDDTIALPDSLAQLLAATEITGPYGFMCSRVTLENVEETNQPAPVRTRKRQIAMTKYLADGIMEVGLCSFVSVLVPRSIIDQVGYPVAEMFIWGDDSEYTTRCAMAGPGFVAGKSRVIHKTTSNTRWLVSEEESLGRIRMYRHKFRNNLIIYAKWHGFAHFLVFLYGVGCQIVRSLFAKTYRFERIKAIFTGLSEGCVILITGRWSDQMKVNF